MVADGHLWQAGPMYAITVSEPGGADKITWAQVPTPEPGPGEVLVRTQVDNTRQARTWGTISLVTQLGYLAAYLCSGVLVDRVLQPLLEPGQRLSASLGAVVGIGPGRGAALLVGLMGAVMALVALTVRLQRRRLASPQ